MTVHPDSFVQQQQPVSFVKAPLPPSPQAPYAVQPHQGPPHPAVQQPQSPLPRPAIDALLDKQVELGASDLHLAADTFPWISLHGSTLPMTGMTERTLPADTLRRLLRQIVSDAEWKSYEDNKRLDFSHATDGSRFRGHYAVSGGEPMAVFRAIPNEVPNFDELGLPEVVRKFADAEAGLYIFVGVTGSGKSSSLNALIKEIKIKYAKKIVTIESPVEFKHGHGKSMIVQREVGEDVESFEIGIEDAMREAPDIIVVGEMRDSKTMQAALRAATSGHVVFTTLHAESTADAPTRILDSMPPARLAEVRSMLSRTLRGVVYQKLLPVKGGKGRALAAEVLHMNPAISNMIRNNALEGIAAQLNDGASGNVPFEVSLSRLVLDGTVNEATAERAELVPGSFQRAYRAGRRE